jgi:hypothetical protein
MMCRVVGFGGLSVALSLGGCGGFSGDPVDIGLGKGDPRCSEAAGELRCSHATMEFHGGSFDSSTREVHFMTPEGDAPAPSTR